MDEMVARPSGSARWGVVLGVLAAAPALFFLRGFTVDDALIPARYAAHLAQGLGYRFNAHGPSTDGVTPLGWPYLLSPFATNGPLAALAAARAIGIAAWLCAAAALGACIAAVPGTRWRYAAWALVMCSAPLGAWAAAGLETGVVMALSTAAAVLPARGSFSLAGGALAGACAWLRPEMIAFAGVLGAGRAALAKGRRVRVLTLFLAIAPWCCVAAIRWSVWGRPAPLAVLAKPSDLAHGLSYVLPSLVLTGAPLTALAPLGYRTLSLWPRVLTAGAFVHLAVVALAGGDWMPLARLIAPALPPLVLVAAHLLGGHTSRHFACLRLALGCAGELFVFATRGPAAARVLADRLALIDAARSPLAGASRIATIDVGWVGAASEADIIDLAGATDPEIAALPGGHTSKMISGPFVTGRQPDKLVFQVASEEIASDEMPSYTRTTERRLAEDPLVRRTYRRTWMSPGNLPIRYVILSATPVPALGTHPRAND